MLLIPPSSQPGIAEWLKILISALSGMIAGLCAEPIKQLISQRVQARHVRQRVYYDFGRVMFYVTKGHSEWSRSNLVEILRTDAFDYYHDVKREFLYLLPEFQSVINLGMYIKNRRKQLSSEEITVADAVTMLSETFNEYHSSGEIDWKALTANKLRYSQRFEKRYAAIAETKKRKAAVTQ